MPAITPRTRWLHQQLDLRMGLGPGIPRALAGAEALASPPSGAMMMLTPAMA